MAVDIPAGLSSEFFDLIKNIGDSTSKQEEDRIMAREKHVLKQRFKQSEISGRQMKEYVVRGMYCEMMGHAVDFAYIHAVNMTQQTDLLAKRTGYLAVMLFLNPSHELMIMLVSSFRRDLQSSNYLEVCAALNTVVKLIPNEYIPAIQDEVIKLLTHQEALVRKKAVMAVQCFLLRSPDTMTGMQDKFRRALCDPDPSVMGASLTIFLELAKKNAPRYRDLVPSFVEILEQVIQKGKLARDFEYQKVPAPWIQMKLLRLLALLCAGDQRSSESVYTAVKTTMLHADCGVPAGFAVVYECVRTITTIYPSPPLIEAAGQCIATFVASSNHNLMYMGICALGDIVQVNPRFAGQHQRVVIDCLEDADETLRRKTLDLLYKMTNPSNITVIASKLIAHLTATVDPYLRRELVSRITELSERYAPNPEWFVSTMNKVFEVAGSHVRTEAGHNLCRLIAEGTGESEESDAELRAFAVASYLDIIERPRLPDILVQVMAWVLGEYAYVAADYSLADVTAKLCALLDRQFADATTRRWIVAALAKIAAQSEECSSQIQEVIQNYQSSVDVDLQQRCHEIKTLMDLPATIEHVLPVDASCEDIEVDVNLSFLDGYVQAALASGAKTYRAGVLDRLEAQENKDDDLKPATLRFDAYPVQKQAAAPTQSALPEAPTSHVIPEEMGSGGLRTTPAKNKWSLSGFQGNLEAAAAPPSAVAGATAAPSTAAPEPAPTTAGAEGTPEPTPHTPRQLTAKEREDQALFAGVADASPTSAGVGVRKVGVRKTTPRQRARNARGEQSPATGTARGEQSPATGTARGEQSTATASTPATTAPSGGEHHTPPSSGGALFDVFASPGTSAPPPAKSAADDVMSLFEGVQAIPAAAPPMQDTREPRPSARIMNAVGASAEALRPAISTPSAQLDFCTVPRDDGAAVVLVITNTSSEDLKEVSLVVDPAAALTAALDGDPLPRITRNSATFSTVSSSVTLLVKLTLGQYAPTMAVRGRLTINSSSHNFQLPDLGIVDFLRPLDITTPEYGAKWGNLSAERKAVLPPLAPSVAATMPLLAERAHLHPIQIIAVEGILAATVTTDELVLAHIKLSPAGLSVTVRSRQGALSDAVLRLITSASMGG